MKRVLSADFFEFRKSNLFYIVPIIAVVLGFILPMLYFGLFALLNYLSGFEQLKTNPEFSAALSSLDSILTVLNAKSVFLSTLPMSQGFGVVIIGIMGFKAVRPFGTGIYRNKIIAKIPRGQIYVSESVVCVVAAEVSMIIYTVTSALTSLLAFGKMEIIGREILTVCVLSVSVYMFYTAVAVYTAFFSRSVPLTLVISILLPVLTQTIISFVSPVIMSAPEVTAYIMTALPSFQCIYMASANAPDAVLIIAPLADILWTVLLTAAGAAHFRKKDIN